MEKTDVGENKKEATNTTLKSLWRHDHTFGQDKAKSGERRTLIVIAMTAITMVVEIVAGLVYGSMALLADGLHMASHTVALGLAAFAYIYARRHAHDRRFSFGTGKVNSLAGFSGAMLLAMFALLMGWASVQRFFHPVSIGFDQAIAVAVLGLLVNVASVFVLGGHHHGYPQKSHFTKGRHKASNHNRNHEHEDHNLRSAYLHVLADALTSLLAIFALLTGKYFGQIWLDPAMGIVGAMLVARWSVGLLYVTSRVLLDREGPELIRQRIREAIEAHDGDQITDLHVWSIGPNIYAAIISVATSTQRSSEDYKSSIPKELGIVHMTIEVNPEKSISSRNSTRDSV